MRAVQVKRLDGPESVELVEVDEPRPSDDAVIVDVHAAGVTFPEVLLTRGLYQYKPELPFILGAEVAGVVRSAPEGAAVSAGQRVAGLPMFGAFAEQVAIEPDAVFPLPDSVSYAAGCAIPINYLTMQFGLRRRGRIAEGETVLVHGAAGGIGTATIQLARAYGARVIAVVSSEEKGELAKRLGAHDVVLADGFLAAVKELTSGEGVDIVVDPVGGDRFTDSLRSLRPEGRLLVIGFTGGEIPTVRVNRLLLNNIEVVGVGWGAFVTPRPGLRGQQWAELIPLMESGVLDPPLSASYPLERVVDALQTIDDRTATGKLVLTVR